MFLSFHCLVGPWFGQMVSDPESLSRGIPGMRAQPHAITQTSSNECCVLPFNHRGNKWGWPDYLPYVHGRMVVNVINEFAQFQNKDETIASIKAAIAEQNREGTSVFIADQLAYPEAHLNWLEQTTGLEPKDLTSLGGTAAFVCYERTFDRIE